MNIIKTTSLLFLITAIAAIVYGIYKNIKNDSPPTAYIINARDTNTIAKEGPIFLGSNKITINRLNSFGQIIGVINNQFGNEASTCIQNAWDNSTDPIGVILDNSNLITKYLKLEINNIESLKKLDRADLSDTSQVNKIGIENGENTILILNGLPLALKPINDMYKCSQNIHAWLISADQKQ